MFSFKLSKFKTALIAASACIFVTGCGTSAHVETSESQIMNASRNLSISQWFSKQGLSAEETRTVDAILDYIRLSGGPSGDVAAVARFAERKLDVMALDGADLRDSSPLLALKALVHVTLTGNFFSQAQINELISSLPNLRTISIDASVVCPTGLNPRVTCLK